MSDESSYLAYCTSCGERFASGNRFCGFCGSKRQLIPTDREDAVLPPNHGIRRQGEPAEDDDKEEMSSWQKKPQKSREPASPTRKKEDEPQVDPSVTEYKAYHDRDEATGDESAYPFDPDKEDNSDDANGSQKDAEQEELPWHLIVPLETEIEVHADHHAAKGKSQQKKKADRRASSATWATKRTLFDIADLLVRVFEFVEVDKPTLASMAAVNRQWAFYTEHMPHWREVVNVSAINDPDLTALAVKYRHTPGALTRTRARKIEELRPTWNLETRLRWETDPGFCCPCYEPADCFESCMCCFCYDGMSMMCCKMNRCVFLCSGIMWGIAMLITAGLMWYVPYMGRSSDLTGINPSARGTQCCLCCETDDGSCNDACMAYCCLHILCPCCTLCQHRRVFGAYSVMCDVERRPPMSDVLEMYME